MDYFNNLIFQNLSTRKRIIDDLISNKLLINKINQFVNLTLSTINNNNILFFAGNGGSAAQSQHIAAEYVCKFKYTRKSFGAISLTTDTSNITAIANDFSFDEVFSRQIESLARKNDLFYFYSTSGNSKNIIKAALKAKEKEGVSIAMTGNDGGLLSEVCDSTLIIPSNDTAVIQEMHMVVGHIICELVEEKLK